MNRSLSCLVLISVFVFVSACSPKVLPQPVENSSQVQAGTAYPISGDGTIVPDSNLRYPAPITPLTQGEIKSLKVSDPPIPDSTMGSISGILLNGIQSTLMGNTDIYLTKGIGDNNGIIPPVLVGSLPSRGDVAGRTQSDGTFNFVDVPPGNYFLIVSMDLSPVVSSVKEDIALKIVVEKGKSTNLGVVFYTAK